MIQRKTHLSPYGRKIANIKLEENILRALNRRIVYFEYKKKDGSYAVRRGTRAKSYLPVKAWRGVKNATHRSTENVITYWDFYRDGWRCFIVDNFIREVAKTNILF